ncbi:carbonic anhydrase [Rhizopogon salebrosus TDB-379]|nr:carbonic anhydrase [Rhizopogon salebrosus TDB-379]
MAEVDFEQANDTGNIQPLFAPTRHVVVLTCMDARLDPVNFRFPHMYLKREDAHIIRNAGGFAREAVRSIVISQKLLGTRDIMVVHHTQCGAPAEELITAHPGDDIMEFGSFRDVDTSVRDNVTFLRNHPDISKEGKITGWVYEVETGKMRQVM